MSFNLLNRSFYDEMKIQKLQEFAKLTGFSDGTDIQTLYPMLQNAQTIVELGSGYGRGLAFLKQKGFLGKLIGIERAPHFVSYANEQLAGHSQSHCQDLMEDIQIPHCDALLWLWSGLMEFSADEQANRIHYFSQFLRPEGKFFIDLPFQEVSIVGEYQDEKSLILQQPWGKLYAFQPNDLDMDRFALKAQLKVLSPIIYATSKGYQRKIYIFQKPA
ncbi:class I SAM-dependent methyltransferase [Persicobacter diffluens]|uniref:Class I SAM-dependent methyltransferase n=1 Tax=Persicobacter diffluens TaxID=981 RepID=A0AAN4VWS1_9BACT|nr:hypothetical protein PEDI_17000 [Persicobacter diffluens]